MDIRVKLFEADLIASCMTIQGGVFPLHIDFIKSVILSPTLLVLCLSLLHCNATLASACFQCEKTCQDEFALVLKNFSHQRYNI